MPNLEIKDNDGWIPLHSAVKVDPLIVRAIINAIKTSKQVLHPSRLVAKSNLTKSERFFQAT